MHMNSKEIIRVNIKKQRDNQAPGWIRKISDRIQRRVLDLDEWKDAGRICCYMALPNEVHTECLVKTAWNSEKKVCVPVFRKEVGHYDLAWLNNEDTIVVGHGHVPEPSKPVWYEDASGPDEQIGIDIVVIPGMAFDRSGGRIGQGYGHYDRLLVLKSLRNAFKIGLAFEFQMRNETPVQDHDIRMDAVVTERDVYWQTR